MIRTGAIVRGKYYFRRKGHGVVLSMGRSYARVQFRDCVVGLPIAWLIVPKRVAV